MFNVNGRTMVLMALLPLVAASCASTGRRSAAKKMPPALALMVRKEMNVLTDRLELTGEQIPIVLLVMESHYCDLYAQAENHRFSGRALLEAIRTAVNTTTARTIEKLEVEAVDVGDLQWIEHRCTADRTDGAGAVVATDHVDEVVDSNSLCQRSSRRQVVG